MVRLYIIAVGCRSSFKRLSNNILISFVLVLILVPACLFMLSKTASPIHLCSLLSSMMRVLAQNENKVTEQLLQFLVCDCLRPIPGVLGVQFQIGDESTTLSVPYNNNQLQNSNSLDHYYHLSILFENPF